MLCNFRKMVRKAEVGTVSHGTMRTEDLLEAFTSELEHHVNRNADAWCTYSGRVERDRLMRVIGDAREADPDTGDAIEIVDELIDELNVFALDGCYFGANEGDGSDYGFWPTA